MERANKLDLKISIPFLENGVINWESDPLAEHLLSAGKLRQSELAQVKKVTPVRTEALGIALVRYGLLSEKDLAETLCELTGIAVVEQQQYQQNVDIPQNISLRFLKSNHVVPLELSDVDVSVVMAEPRDYETLQSLSLALDRKVIPLIGTVSDIQKKLTELENNKLNEEVDLAEYAEKDFDHDDISRLKDIASEAPVIRTVNNILQQAIELRASDVHLEPFNEGLRVRYRVDGMLRIENEYPANMAAAIGSRVKIMANMDIAENRLPQDGRIQIKITGRELDIRVSTLPTMHGESIVIRVLDKEAVVLDFARLGFDEELQSRIIKKLKQPNGIILVTGPTGSGKTTTLYTGLSQINTEDKKIITVEDPVEYQLTGINQVAVKPKIGLEFSTVLRSVLRQDPDIIMVGEMRDVETAKIAMQAALTGHLVLSTLHTNDAVSGITRLIDMGIEDYLVTATVNTIIAQRLVRKLCDECKIDTGDGFIPCGCSVCRETGYRDRVAVIEILEMTGELRNSIMQGMSYEDIRRQAIAGGMMSMLQHGMSMVEKGVTSREEVLRAVAS